MSTINIKVIKTDDLDYEVFINDDFVYDCDSVNLVDTFIIEHISSNFPQAFNLDWSDDNV